MKQTAPAPASVLGGGCGSQQEGRKENMVAVSAK